MDKEIRRSIILDNYNNACYRCRHDGDCNYRKTNTRSATCIDNLDLYLKIKDDKIEDISFDGEACVISTSSTNIMSNLLKGKSIDEAIEIIDNYKKMVREEKYDENKLGEAIVYDDICKQPNRVKCAILSWNGVYKELVNYKRERAS